MASIPEFINDEPIEKAAFDILGWSGLVDEMVTATVECDPPYVFGVHGDWGAGKTSLLNLFRDELAAPAVRDNVLPVFFEAWKYQYEPAPIVALLLEIRQQITWSRNFGAKLMGAAGKLGEVAIRSALIGFEDITKKIGVQASKIQQTGEEWEKRRHATDLPSNVIRDLLNQAIETLIGSDNKNQRRLVIIIDDLDRCHHETAFQLLEGIKIYLNIKSCVFFLGINQQEIHRAIAANLDEEGFKPGQDPEHRQELEVRAREYLEKLCTHIWPLPIMDSSKEYDLVSKWVSGTGNSEVKAVVERYGPCFPANPRRVKSCCNTVNRILHRVGRAEVNRNEAAAIVIAAYFQTYHHEISRVIQREPDFYRIVQEWVESPEPDLTRNGSRQLQTLSLPYRPGEIPPDDPTGRPRDSQSRFLDPARGNTLHIQRLIAESRGVNSLFVSQLLSL